MSDVNALLRAGTAILHAALTDARVKELEREGAAILAAALKESKA